MGGAADRWVSWLLGAFPAGRKAIRRHQPDAIWSTYPLATAHIVGYFLSRASGLPWIADFRDPMVEHVARTGITYPTDRRVRASRLRVERMVATGAAAMVFCTRGAADIFAERYPEVSPDRIHVIPNGYDETAFPRPTRSDGGPPQKLTLLHSGVLYPGPDRDPSALSEGIARTARR